MTGANRLNWAIDGKTWPHRQASRFVSAAGLTWHVQIMGPESAPVIVLLHGTGAASHSWRHVMPRLSTRFRLVVPDLPGHGFTRTQARADLSLDGMARAIRQLLGHLAVDPDTVIGHSAGAAIAVALADGLQRETGRTGKPRQLIGINGAFLPIRGYRLLSPMAKALFANPLSASMFSALARSTPLGGNLLDATQSAIDAEGKAIYRMLLAAPDHVRGALGMMAAWDLGRLDSMLGRLTAATTLIAARDDTMVPPGNSVHAASLVPKSRLVMAERGGHLLHECEPDLVAGWITAAIPERQPNGADAA